MAKQCSPAKTNTVRRAYNDTNHVIKRTNLPLLPASPILPLPGIWGSSALVPEVVAALSESWVVKAPASVFAGFLYASPVTTDLTFSILSESCGNVWRSFEVVIDRRVVVYGTEMVCRRRLNGEEWAGLCRRGAAEEANLVLDPYHSGANKTSLLKGPALPVSPDAARRIPTEQNIATRPSSSMIKLHNTAQPLHHDNHFSVIKLWYFHRRAFVVDDTLR